ncbi:MAG: chemotaxis-specific protein-glutamate methyltransferase CheB [Myxococcales bacterium]
MNDKLRVMVVDDSAFNRRTIGDLLANMDGVEVVGKAADGDEALRLAASLAPDLITLDLEMPRMDGFTFLRLLMARQPTPVIVVSGNSARENVFRALELGALDFIAKPTRTIATDLTAIQQELAQKVAMVRMLTPAGRDPRKRALRGGMFSTATDRHAALPGMPSSERELPLGKLLVIGASTGGPSALVEMFAQFKAHTNAAIVVAQHMPERFTKTFAERLHKLGGVKVAEAREFEPLAPGRAFLCPGGKCIEVVTYGGGFAVSVVDPAPGDRFIPSVDRLFRSAAEVAGERVVGVVLTGMGDDGARGVVAIKARGGMVLAEAPETAVIYGMPGAAMRTGEVDKSLPLTALATHVAELIV